MASPVEAARSAPALPVAKRPSVTFSSSPPATTPTRRHALPGGEQLASRFQAHVELALHRQQSGGGAGSTVWRARLGGDEKDGTAKSMKVFKGEAKDMLHGIFLVLLLRFLLVLAAALCALGAGALLLVKLQDPSAPLLSYVAFWSAA